MNKMTPEKIQALREVAQYSTDDLIRQGRYVVKRHYLPGAWGNTAPIECTIPADVAPKRVFDEPKLYKRNSIRDAINDLGQDVVDAIYYDRTIPAFQHAEKHKVSVAVVRGIQQRNCERTREYPKVARYTGRPAGAGRPKVYDLTDDDIVTIYHDRETDQKVLADRYGVPLHYVRGVQYRQHPVTKDFPKLERSVKPMVKSGARNDRYLDDPATVDVYYNRTKSAREMSEKWGINERHIYAIRCCFSRTQGWPKVERGVDTPVPAIHKI